VIFLKVRNFTPGFKKQQMNALNKKKEKTKDFVLSAKFKLLSQIKHNLIDNCDFFKSS